MKIMCCSLALVPFCVSIFFSTTILPIIMSILSFTLAFDQSFISEWQMNILTDVYFECHNYLRFLSSMFHNTHLTVWLWLLPINYPLFIITMFCRTMEQNSMWINAMYSLYAWHCTCTRMLIRLLPLLSNSWHTRLSCSWYYGYAVAVF